MQSQRTAVSGIVWQVSLAVVVTSLLAGAASATSYWNSADGDWSVPGNWTGGLPSSSSVAYVGTTAAGGLGMATARIGGDIGTTSARVSLTIGDQAVANGSVIQSAGNVFLGSPTIGNFGTGLYTQNGGTVTAYWITLASQYVTSPRSVSSGTYTLSGNSDGTGSKLTATNLAVGVWGVGTFNQTGGTVIVNNNGAGNSLTLGQNNAGGNQNGNGTYNLNGGGILTIGRGAPGGYPLYQPTPGNLVIGSYGVGVFNLGDALGSGTINEAGPGTIAANLLVRDKSYVGSSGTLRGWGTINLMGKFTNNGVVRADGYGADRTLSITQYSSFTSSIVNPTTNGTNGWFAANHGKLSLKPLAVTSGTNTYNWGENSAYTNIDLVNGLRMTFTGLTAVNQTLAISLLSPDRADVYRGLDKPVGVWDFTPSSALTFASTTLTFRYDDAKGASLGISESDLKLYEYLSGMWQQVPATIDTTNNVLTASNVTSFSQFAVSAGAANWAPGDVNHDGAVDASDIDSIYGHFNVVSSATQWDVTMDGVVNQDDVTYELTDPTVNLLCAYGDANLDHKVSFSDFQLVLNSWHLSGTGWASDDFNGDNTTNFKDFQEMLNHWNPPGTEAAASVPEPATAALVVVAASVLFGRRRR